MGERPKSHLTSSITAKTVALKIMVQSSINTREREGCIECWFIEGASPLQMWIVMGLENTTLSEP